MASVALYGMVATAPARPETDGVMLKLRPPSAVVRDLTRIAGQADKLAELLRAHDTAGALVRSIASHADSRTHARGQAIDAYRGLEGLMRQLRQLCADAESAVNYLRDSKPLDLRSGFLVLLARTLAVFGHKVGTAENSTMVRVARAVWHLLPFEAEDPRDFWRRMVRDGRADLTLIAEVASKSLNDHGGDSEAAALAHLLTAVPPSMRDEILGVIGVSRQPIAGEGAESA
jgi:hypothetical protein